MTKIIALANPTDDNNSTLEDEVVDYDPEYDNIAQSTTSPEQLRADIVEHCHPDQQHNMASALEYAEKVETLAHKLRSKPLKDEQLAVIDKEVNKFLKIEDEKVSKNNSAAYLRDELEQQALWVRNLLLLTYGPKMKKPDQNLPAAYRQALKKSTELLRGLGTPTSDFVNDIAGCIHTYSQVALLEGVLNRVVQAGEDPQKPKLVVMYDGHEVYTDRKKINDLPGASQLPDWTTIVIDIDTESIELNYAETIEASKKGGRTPASLSKIVKTFVGEKPTSEYLTEVYNSIMDTIEEE